MENLTKVYFKRCSPAGAPYPVPKITANAFAKSGTYDNPTVFYVPWTEVEHRAMIGKEHAGNVSGLNLLFGATVNNSVKQIYYEGEWDESIVQDNS